MFSGGSQVIAAGAALVRAKVAAVCIGVGGVGVLGLYTQVANLISEIAALGLGSSAVREVAIARGSGDSLRLAQVIRSLRVLVLASGIAATAVCIVLARWLSVWTFGDKSHQTGFLSLAARCLRKYRWGRGVAAGDETHPSNMPCNERGSCDLNADSGLLLPAGGDRRDCPLFAVRRGHAGRLLVVCKPVWRSKE